MKKILMKNRVSIFGLTILLGIIGGFNQIPNKPINSYAVTKLVPIERSRLFIRTNKILTKYHCSSLTHVVFNESMANQLNPPLVASIIVTESSCKSAAVSPIGAIGLMQVRPEIWKIPVRNLKNPWYNISIGTRILHQYISRYGFKKGLDKYSGHEYNYYHKVIAKYSE
jgi:soluble lytic murein transglycosylase-like protein